MVKDPGSVAPPSATGSVDTITETAGRGGGFGEPDGNAVDVEGETT